MLSCALTVEAASSSRMTRAVVQAGQRARLGHGCRLSGLSAAVASTTIAEARSGKVSLGFAPHPCCIHVLLLEFPLCPAYAKMLRHAACLLTCMQVLTLAAGPALCHIPACTASMHAYYCQCIADCYKCRTHSSSHMQAAVTQSHETWQLPPRDVECWLRAAAEALEPWGQANPADRPISGFHDAK